MFCAVLGPCEQIGIGYSGIQLIYLDLDGLDGGGVADAVGLLWCNDGIWSGHTRLRQQRWRSLMVMGQHRRQFPRAPGLVVVSGWRICLSCT